MRTRKDVTTASEIGEDETSKLGVLVPEKVQDGNRALVEYRNDGSIRNKLGPGTTDRLTHGLAMYFWRRPDDLERVAQSEYVAEKEHFDGPEDYKKFIQTCQERHLEDTLVVARNLLHGRLTKDHRETNTDVFTGVHPEAVPDNSQATPQQSSLNAPRDRTIPAEAQQQVQTDFQREVHQTIRDEVEVLQQRYENKLEGLHSEIEEMRQQLSDK